MKWWWRDYLLVFTRYSLIAIYGKLFLCILPFITINIRVQWLMCLVAVNSMIVDSVTDNIIQVINYIFNLQILLISKPEPDLIDYDHMIIIFVLTTIHLYLKIMIQCMYNHFVLLSVQKQTQLLSNLVMVTNYQLMSFGLLCLVVLGCIDFSLGRPDGKCQFNQWWLSPIV